MLVTILDILAQMNAKAQRPKGAKMPDPVSRPWGKNGKRAAAPKVQAREWDDMEKWVRSRVATQ